MRAPGPHGAAGQGRLRKLAASLTVDYWLDRPAGDGLLQLTYASPLVMVAEALTELFDAVTSTVTWTGQPEESNV